MSNPPPLQPAPGAPYAPPPVPTYGESVACSMCHQPANRASAFSIQGQWFVCPNCFPAYKAAYPQYFTPNFSVTPFQFARERDILLTGKTADLPRRCVKCNGTDGAVTRRQSFYWFPPWVYLLIVPGILIFAIVALVIRQKADVEVTLCGRHNTVRTRHIIAVCVMWLVAFGLFFVAAAANSGWPVLGGVLLILTALIYQATAVPILTPQKIDHQHARLKGAGRAFLDSIG